MLTCAVFVLPTVLVAQRLRWSVGEVVEQEEEEAAEAEAEALVREARASQPTMAGPEPLTPRRAQMRSR